MYFDPKLVQRLNRPLQRPGVTNHRMAEHLMARSQYFLDRLPLLDQQLSRWSTVVEQDSEEVPIVYVQNAESEVLATEPLKTPNQPPVEIPAQREAPHGDHPLIPPTPATAHSTEAQPPVQPIITPDPSPLTQPILEPVNPPLQGEGIIQAQRHPESLEREVHHPAPPTNRKTRKQARKQAHKQKRSQRDRTATPPQTATPQALTPPAQPSETAALTSLVVQPTPTPSPSPDLPSPREQNPLESSFPEPSTPTSPHSEPAATPALPSVQPIPQSLTPLTPLGGEGIIQAKQDPHPERAMPPLLIPELPPTESANLPTPPQRTLPQTPLEPQQPLFSVHPNPETDFIPAHLPSQVTLETPRVFPTSPSTEPLQPTPTPSPAPALPSPREQNPLESSP
ncbi:hypothetical protein K4A83_13000, partial [Spirulina subsalsa FACHB-351]|nr:hypothetical protein [Spirulina subsalsa FACHB-351]